MALLGKTAKFMLKQPEDDKSKWILNEELTQTMIGSRARYLLEAAKNLMVQKHHVGHQGPAGVRSGGVRGRVSPRARACPGIIDFMDNDPLCFKTVVDYLCSESAEAQEYVVEAEAAFYLSRGFDPTSPAALSSATDTADAWTSAWTNALTVATKTLAHKRAARMDDAELKMQKEFLPDAAKTFGVRTLKNPTAPTQGQRGDPASGNAGDSWRGAPDGAPQQDADSVPPAKKQKTMSFFDIHRLWTCRSRRRRLRACRARLESRSCSPLRLCSWLWFVQKQIETKLLEKIWLLGWRCE